MELPDTPPREAQPENVVADQSNSKQAEKVVAERKPHVYPMVTSDGNNYIKHLPFQVMETIFTHLDTKDLYYSMLVNRRWFSIINSKVKFD